MLKSIRKPAARLLAAAVLALSASACDVVIGGLNARETAKDTWQRSFPLAPDGRFELVNQNGRVEIQAVEGGSVEIVAERSAGAATVEDANDLLKQVEIQTETSPGLVRITTKAPRSFGLHGHVEVKYLVKLPRQASAAITNTNGSVKVVGLAGALSVESTNGGVNATGVSGGVTASTTNGSVEIEVDAVDAEGIRLETTNGSVELRLPRTAKADVRARTVNGGVRTTDLEVESSTESGGRRRVEGRLNGGGARIEVETVNGGIRLVGK